MPYKDKAKRREATRRWRANQSDEAKERQRQRVRDWNAANPTYARDRHRKIRADLKTKVFAAYGARCTCCGETEPQFLTLDHVNGGGNQHRKEIGKGTPCSSDQMMRWVVDNNFPDTMQILCYNCNCGRHRGGGTCPHKQTRDQSGPCG